jgi:hypothetical protein
MRARHPVARFLAAVSSAPTVRACRMHPLASGARPDGWRSGFSLVAGGPLYRLLRRAHTGEPGPPAVLRAALLVSGIAFGPVLLLSAIELTATGRVDPLLHDLSVYARFLVAVPLFFGAEYGLHVRCRRTVERLVQGHYLDDDGFARIERALRRCERLRDLWSFELVLAAAALFGGQTTLASGLAGWLESAPEVGRVSAARLWYAAVGLPIFQFLLFRWLWRWLIWSLWLLDVARIRLRLVPAHPDHSGGIGGLADPTYAFSFFAAGASSVLAGAWAMRLALHHVQIEALVLPACLLVLIAMLICFGPLLAFAPALIRGRFEGVRQYSLVATTYTRLFHRRWVEQGADDSLLGSPDIQSLADLQGSFEDMARMRPVPFGRRPVIVLVASIVAPMLPLLTFKVPLDELLLKLGSSLLGVPG